MSTYKSKQIFAQELNKDKKENNKLTSPMVFAEQVQFVPASTEEEQTLTEKQLEKAIKLNKKRKWFGVSSLLILFTGLVTWQAVDNIMNAWQSSDWLTIGWSSLIALLAGIGGTAIGKELWILRKLRHHFSTHEESKALLHSNSVGKGKAFCEKLAKKSGITEENPHFTRWYRSINDSHSDGEILEMYDGIVLTKQDQKAKAIIIKQSTEAALLVAVSPLAIADMLFVAWRNFKLIDQLAGVYGVELSYWSRLKLFKLVLMNMATAGTTEIVADASMDLLSMDLAAKLSTRMAQGFGVGILTARLGIKAMSLLRPVPWNQENKLHLSDIRKTLLLALKSTT